MNYTKEEMYALPLATLIEQIDEETASDEELAILEERILWDEEGLCSHCGAMMNSNGYRDAFGCLQWDVECPFCD